MQGKTAIKYTFLFSLLLAFAFITTMVFANPSTFTLVSPTPGNMSNITTSGYFFVNFTSNESFIDKPLLQITNITTSGVGSFPMTVNGSAATAYYASFNVTGLKNGTYTWRIIANTSTLGANQTFGNFTVNLGRVQPFITFPDSYTNTTDTTPEIRVESNSSIFANMTFKIFVTSLDGTSVLDSTTTILNATSGRFNITDELVPGQYNIIVETGNGADLSTNSTAVTINLFSNVVSVESPINGTNTSDTTPEVSVKVINSNLTNISIVIYANRIASVNTTILNDTLTYFNLSALTTSRYNITAEAIFGNDLRLNSTFRTILLDTSGPTYISTTLTNITSTTGENVTARINVSAVDTESTVDTCFINIYGTGGTTQYNNTDALYNGSGSTRHCSFEIGSSMISGLGRFTIETYANNSAGVNSAARNYSNFTNNVLTGDAWNLISSTRNSTLEQIGNMSYYITHVSWFNNSNGSYVNYIKGTATNAPITVTEGDAVYVYANKTISLVRLYANNLLTRSVNLTNSTVNGTWHQVGHFNSSVTLGQLCSLKSGVMYFTYVAANESRYYTYRCGFTLNSGVVVPKGYGVWLLLSNQTENFVMTKPVGD